MIKNLLNKISLSIRFSLILFAHLLVLFCMVGGLVYISHLIGFISFDRPFEILIASFVACFILGIIHSFTVIPKTMKPFQQVINCIEQLAKGDFSARLPFYKPPKLNMVAKSFNKMATELSSIELLRKDFINNFSHEFKTPIASIKGFAQILKYKDITDQEREEYLDIVIDECERLSSLATNVLNLTKIETQNIIGQTQKFNISEQLRQCILLFSNKIEKKCLNIIINPTDFYIVGNKELLQQAFINLLDNAIKFSVKNGIIEIDIKENDTHLIIIIKDNGIGISLDSLPKIFDKFYQADNSHSTQGNGIGLAVVKKIINLHLGDIIVNSIEGKGTAFTINLPL